MARLKDLPLPKRRRQLEQALKFNKSKARKADARKKASKPPARRKKVVAPKRSSRTRRSR